MNAPNDSASATAMVPAGSPNGRRILVRRARFELRRSCKTLGVIRGARRWR